MTAAQPAAVSGAELAHRLRRQWALVEVAATLCGALVLVGFLHALHVAQNPGHGPHNALVGTLQVLSYMAIALPLGWWWRERRTRELWRWLDDERAPTAAERDLVLSEPLRELAVPAVLWAGAALLFPVLQLPDHPHYAWNMALTITLGGLTTCAIIYLIVERLLRPVTARALALEPPDKPVGPGVSTRLITAWALASGLPLLGVVALALSGLNGEIDRPAALAVVVLILGTAGLAVGAGGVVLSARSLADPIAAVRAGLSRVHAGDLETRVEVDDGSELGLLEAGFNEMAAGLRERERLRDLFGRHVGEDVARRALANGVELGGEVREVAALFIDLVGSTALASRRPPTDVVSLLNRFFVVVVDVVEEHGGWVNRFEGDGALCVFGAPNDQPDAAGGALAAARTLRQRLREELPDVDVGIGVSAGLAVAGNVGAERRLEYTVIGDAINEAARLCELAKREPGQVLASASALQRASDREGKRWRLGNATTVRGRQTPTRLARPVAPAPVEAA